MGDENILSSVPGPYVSDALRTLPNAATATVNDVEAVIDVPGIGTVRVLARRIKSKKGRSSHYFWSAERAIMTTTITLA